MEEYLKILLEQIRCRRAWPMIEEEIRGHILDQAQENRRQGMEEEEAIREAVRDMGDPVEAGVSLDRIHRPKAAWSILLLMGAVALCSIAIQWMLGKADTSLGADYGWRHVAGVAAGYLAMLAVYRLDYSYIGKYARQMAAVLCAAVAMLVFRYGIGISGAKTWIVLGDRRSSIIFLMYLFLPLYGALLYRYRGTGYRGIGKCLLWMLPPVFLAIRIPCISLALELALIMAVMLSTAVGKDWFHIKKARFLSVFWAAALGLPALFLAFALHTGFFASYQMERIKSFAGLSTGYVDYAGEIAAEYIRNSRFIGGSGAELAGYLPDMGNDYILVFLASYYGIAAAVLAGLLLFAIAAKTIRISFAQKNQLGMMMGCGCGLVLEMMTLEGILRNFGLIPATRIFFPFFSTSQMGVIVSYVLVGIVLSVYRYQSVLPAEPA